MPFRHAFLLQTLPIFPLQPSFATAAPTSLKCVAAKPGCAAALPRPAEGRAMQTRVFPTGGPAQSQALHGGSRSRHGPLGRGCGCTESQTRRGPWPLAEGDGGYLHATTSWAQAASAGQWLEPVQILFTRYLEDSPTAVFAYVLDLEHIYQIIKFSISLSITTQFWIMQCDCGI